MKTTTTIIKALFCFLVIVQYPVTSFAQSWLWARGGASSPFSKFNYGISGCPVACDSSGNVYMADGASASLVKFDSSGNFRWLAATSTMPSKILNCSATSLVMGAGGNILITGLFEDTVIYGKDTLKIQYPGWDNLFILDYDSSGNELWATQPKAASRYCYVHPGGICTDRAGDIYVTGGFSDTLVFGKDTLKTPKGSAAAFIVKYDTLGNVRWVRASSSFRKSGGNTWGNTISADKAGNIFVAGYCRDSIIFGGDTIRLTSCAFLVKYDSTGNLIWAEGFSPVNIGSAIIPTSINTDNKGNCYLTGYFSDTLKLGSFTINPPRNEFLENVIMAKFDGSGKALWAKGTTYNSLYCLSLGNQVSCDKWGNVYLIGGTGSNDCSIRADTQSIGTVTFIRTAAFFNFIIKYDSLGNTICSEDIGNKPCYGSGGIGSVAADQFGNVYITGGAGYIFSPDTLKGYSAEFLSKWTCNGAIPTKSGTIKLTKDVQIFPDPNQGKFSLNILNAEGKAQLEIYNMLGEKIYSEGLLSGKSLIDIGARSPGIYLYRVITETGTLIGSGKFVVEK